MGFSGVFLWRRGAKKSKQSASGVFVLGCSSSLPLVWTWILAIVYTLVPLWCVYTVRQRICLYICVLSFFWLPDPLCIHRFFAPMPPAPPLFEFPPPLVCFWLEKHALVFCLFFLFSFFFSNAIPKVVVTASPPGNKTNVSSYFFNMSISGLHSWIFLLISLLFCFVIFYLS